MCRLIHEQCKANGIKIRFLDPYIVCANNIKQMPEYVEKYVTGAMVKLQEMDAIFLPYNQ